MELMEAIRQRQSIRSFSEEAVSRDLLEDLVAAAVEAPTAGNLQAWRFIICDEPHLVRSIDDCSPGLGGHPPVIIAVASDMEEVSRRGSEHSKIYGCMMDASMAAENLMLRAVELGLGTCAIKSYDNAAVRKLLALPDTLRLEMLISVGYAARKNKKPARKPMEKVILYNAPKREGSAETDISDSTELLLYMITSAARLPGEPRSYAPLRMIESARRFAVLQIARLREEAESSGENERYADRIKKLEKIIAVIDAGRGLSMTDPEGFNAMLSDAAAAATELIV